MFVLSLWSKCTNYKASHEEWFKDSFSTLVRLMDELVKISLKLIIESASETILWLFIFSK